jgi:hypothetical protein
MRLDTGSSQDQLQVLDHRAEVDERKAIPHLPDLSDSIHGVFRPGNVPKSHGLNPLNKGAGAAIPIRSEWRLSAKRWAESA